MLERFGKALPTKTIARLLVDKHPALFKDIEAARSSVRYYRGRSGQADRAQCANTTHFRAAGKQSDGNIPLPDPIKEGADWDVFQVDFQRALLIQDIHIPFHDPKAVALALDTGRRLKVDTIIINGDALDFYRISFWEKNPEARSFNDEVQAGRLFLEHLRDRFPKARIIFKEGNHEERLWRYAWSRCADMFTVQDAEGRRIFSLRSLLDTDEYGVEVVADKRPVRCGEHLHILHGHEFRAPFQNPVNPARGLYLRAKCNAVCGDLHQTSNHVENGLTHTVSCWSAGALCDLHPAYMPINKWNHGFGVIELNRKAWSYSNMKIINGTVVAG